MLSRLIVALLRTELPLALAFKRILTWFDVDFDDPRVAAGLDAADVAYVRALYA